MFFVGDMYEVGAESGRYYCLNVPLRDGIDDQSELIYGLLFLFEHYTIKLKSLIKRSFYQIMPKHYWVLYGKRYHIINHIKSVKK